MVKDKTIYNDIKMYWNTEPVNENLKILNKVEPENLKNDVTVILTEWEEFKKLDYSKTKLFDGRYIISNKIVEEN